MDGSSVPHVTQNASALLEILLPTPDIHLQPTFLSANTFLGLLRFASSVSIFLPESFPRGQLKDVQHLSICGNQSGLQEWLSLSVSVFCLETSFYTHECTIHKRHCLCLHFVFGRYVFKHRVAVIAAQKTDGCNVPQHSYDLKVYLSQVPYPAFCIHECNGISSCSTARGVIKEDNNSWNLGRESNLSAQ